MSRALQNSELKYPMFEKQAYALVKSLKHFRVFIGYSKVIGYVPNYAVKDVLSQDWAQGVDGLLKSKSMIWK
jgi:hypothetical protein